MIDKFVHLSVMSGGLLPLMGVLLLATLAVIVPVFFVLGVAVQWLLARFRVSPLNSLLATFAASDVPDGWQVIGSVAEGSGVTVDGAPYDGPTGWTHF